LESAAAPQRIRHVVVAAVGMRLVSGQPRWCDAQAHDLALKAIIARQDDAGTVQKRQQTRNNSHLVCLQVTRCPPMREQFGGNRWHWSPVHG
jgi:hypothetical protein